MAYGFRAFARDFLIAQRGVSHRFLSDAETGYNLEGSKANADRLVRLILLIALAMTVPILDFRFWILD